MKNSYLIAVAALALLLGADISARAQDVDKVTVTVPFAFVAGGATLPAGEYTVNRINPGVNRELAIRAYDKTGVLVVPIVFDDASASAAPPKVSFEQIGGQYFLTKVGTPDGVYIFGMPKAMVALAQVKDQGTVSSSGTK